MVYYTEISDTLSVFSPITGDILIISKDKYADYEMIREFCKSEDADFDFIKSLTKGREFDFEICEKSDDSKRYIVSEADSGEVVLNYENKLVTFPLYILNFLRERKNDYNYKDVLLVCLRFLSNLSVMNDEERNKVDTYFLRNDWILDVTGNIILGIGESNIISVPPMLLSQFNIEELDVYNLKKKQFKTYYLNQYKPKIFNFEYTEDIYFNMIDFKDVIASEMTEHNKIEEIDCFFSSTPTFAFMDKKEKYKIYDTFKALTNEELIRTFIEII